MPQYRIDPEDGLAYTFEESLQFYSKRYSRHAIYSYWKGCSSAKASSVAGKHDVNEVTCDTNITATVHANAKQEVHSKGSKGSFQRQGKTRVLQEDVSTPLVDDIFSSLESLNIAKRLTLQKGVERTLKNISELYGRRGFTCPCLQEMLDIRRDACGTTWNLSWVDLHGRRWCCASFIVHTSAGPWRVSINRSGLVCAAFPVTNIDVGAKARVEHRPCLNCICCRAAPSAVDKHALTNQALKAERSRMNGLRTLLQDARAAMCRPGDLDKTSEIHHAIAAWKALDAFAIDLPELADAVKADPELCDFDTAKRLLDLYCSCDVVCVPVRSVRFTQVSISTAFRHGSPGVEVETLVADLLKGAVHPLRCDDLILDGVMYRGDIFSLDNRRLWALQQYQISLYSSDAEVQVRIRLLPWSESATADHFFKKFNSDCAGESVKCRGESVPIGVASTVLQRVVLATSSSTTSQAAKEAEFLNDNKSAKSPTESTKLIAELSEKELAKRKRQSERDKARRRQSAEEAKAQSQKDKARSRRLKQGLPQWQFGDEDFDDLATAQVRVRDILRSFAGTKALPDAEFRVLYDIIQRHPNRVRKRVAEVTRISVGTSEKFGNTPSFWIWRPDGSGEDISMRKCFPK